MIIRLCSATGAFWNGLSPRVPLEESITTNQYKVIRTDHLSHMMRHFFPEGRGFFPDDNAPILMGSPKGLTVKTFSGFCSYWLSNFLNTIGSFGVRRCFYPSNTNTETCQDVLKMFWQFIPCFSFNLSHVSHAVV